MSKIFCYQIFKYPRFDIMYYSIKKLLRLHAGHKLWCFFVTWSRIFSFITNSCACSMYASERESSWGWSRCRQMCATLIIGFENYITDSIHSFVFYFIESTKSISIKQLIYTLITCSSFLGCSSTLAARNNDAAAIVFRWNLVKLKSE